MYLFITIVDYFRIDFYNAGYEVKNTTYCGLNVSDPHDIVLKNFSPVLGANIFKGANMEKVTDERLTITSLKNKVFEEFRFICEEFEIDIKSITPLQFGFVLGEINNRIIKPNESYLIFNQEHEYNSKNLYAMYKYILSPLCSLYNQLTNDIYFCLLFDIELINLEYIYIIYPDMRRTSFKDILQKSEETGLRAYLAERKGNPLGILASLTKYHGWGEAENVRKGETTQEISVQSLPKIGQKE